MNQHQKEPGRDPDSRQGDQKGLEQGGPGGNEEAAKEAYRTSPSVAPVAYQLEEECEEPPTTPPQRISVFTRNVIAATLLVAAGFAVFGVTRSSFLDPPARLETSAAAPAARVASALEKEAFQARAFEFVSESARMSLPAAEAKRIVERANARARMSLSWPELDAEGDDSLPMENASLLKSAEDSLVDAAASAASLHCMDASEVNPALRVRVHVAPDGTVASVGFDGASRYSPETLACIEDVFGELQIATYRGGERTFVRELGGVP